MILAENTLRVMQKRGWKSNRQVEIATGGRIKYGVVDKMRRGLSVRPETAALFGELAGEDPATWRAYAIGIDPRLYASSAEHKEMSADPLLLVGREVDLTHFRQIPLAPGRASADPHMVREAMDAPYSTVGDKLPGEVRGIEVEGDCMLPFFDRGDILFVQETNSAASGDKVIAMLDNFSVTCKVFREAGGATYLEPTNGDGRIESGRFRVVGVVVGFYRRMQRR